MDLPELFLGLISAMPVIRGVTMLIRVRHEISRLATGSPQTSLDEKNITEQRKMYNKME